jgi:hypothetical protein
MRLQLRLAAIALFLGVVAPVASVSAGLLDITRPGDPIKLVNGFNQGDGDFGPPPGAETVDHAIDDVGQKYLNFLDISSGFAVTPSNPDDGAVIGIRLYTANDVPARDPASFQLAGSNGSIDGPWEIISSGNLALPAGRNAGGNAVAIPPMGNAAAFFQEVTFNNTTKYNHYQIVFPTLKDAAAANSMQIAEVELLQIPEPSSILLTLACLLGMCGVFRTRR